jgi:dynein heavy chain 2, cytosolic
MLLDELASSEGNILENKALINSLNQTKQQSTQIESALEESKKLQLSLDQQRNVYKSFANIGSNLFMVIGDLIKINNMYQFSLAAFIKLFKRALETKPQAGSIEEKLSLLSNSLIRLSFSEVGRSLFKSDRLTYSLHFIKGVFPHLFGRNEWEFFSGTVVANSESHMQLPKWATKDRKEVFSMFVNTFQHIIPNMQFESEGVWAPFMKSNAPEKEFPQQVATRVTPF